MSSLSSAQSLGNNSNSNNLRRRSVSAAVSTATGIINNIKSHHHHNNTTTNTNSSISNNISAVPSSPSSARRAQVKHEVLAILRDVLIPGVTCDPFSQQQSASKATTKGGKDAQQNSSSSVSTEDIVAQLQQHLSSPRARFSHAASSTPGSAGATTTNISRANAANAQATALLEVTTSSHLPVAKEDIDDLTQEDHRLLMELDSDEVAPLIAFLKEVAPEIYGDLPARYTPEIGEEIIDRLLHTTGDLEHQNLGKILLQQQQRRRGLTTTTSSAVGSRWVALKSLTQQHSFLQQQQQLQTTIHAPEDDEEHKNNNSALLSGGGGGRRSSFNQSTTSIDSHSFINDISGIPHLVNSPLSQTQQQSNSPSPPGYNQTKRQRSLSASKRGSGHQQHHHKRTGSNHSGDGEMLFAEGDGEYDDDDDDENLARFEAEAAEREKKMQAVLNGVKIISDRHRDRTMKMRMANRDIADVAVQIFTNPGIQVVTTTGRPPPSHAADAVGGIKQQMKTTHGEPPLMVLRQELEDRQALAAAMPRIRARVAEIMGKLSNQGNVSSISSAHKTSTPSKRRSNTPQHQQTRKYQESFLTPASKKSGNSPINNSSGNKTKGGRSDRDISEIARRLKLRSESLTAVAEREHQEAVEKRRAASLLRRELVQQGLWVDVRILSMFRPPTQLKAFVASWQEFKSMVVQAVSPLPPGCSFASISYLSGPGAKSVIDPRHPLLRPLRGFEVVRGCKTRDGTCAALTVSVAIRSSAETAGLPHDFEV
jgi:hypothetical protein